MRALTLPLLALAILLGSVEAHPATAEMVDASTPSPDCPALSGRVVDSSDRPIADAEVTVGSFAGRTDPDGRFEIGAEAPGPELRVDATGFGPWRRWVTCAERDEDLRIVLEPRELLRGRLLGADDTPVEKATLLLESSPQPGQLRRTPIQLELREGGFRAVLPAPGAYDVSFLVPGWRRLLAGNHFVSPATEIDLGSLVLDPGAVIEASFFDRETAAPVAGVRAEVLAAGHGRFWFLARGESFRGASGATGELRLGGLPAGRYALRYAAPGGQQGQRMVSLAEGERVDFGATWVGAGTDLVGRLSFRDGTPARGQVVELHDPAAEITVSFAETVSDQEGRFRIAALEPGEYLLRVGKKALLHSALVEVAPRAGELEIELASVRVRGRATRDGAPLADALLILEHTQDRSASRQKLVVVEGEGNRSRRSVFGAGSTRCEVTTGAAGELTCGAILPGEVEVTWVANLSEVVRRIAVPDAEAAQFEIDFGGAELEGVVLAPPGSSTDGATATALDLDGRSVARSLVEEGGRFTLRQLPEQPLRLQVQVPGGARGETGPVRPSEVAGPQFVELVEAARRDVEVTLRGSEEYGTPEPELVALLPSGLLVTGAALLGGSGVLRDLAPGSYWLAWSDPLYGAGTRSLEVTAGSSPLRMTVPLEGAGSLAVACDAIRHAGVPVLAIRVSTLERGDVSAFLPGVVPGLRFSESCRLELGRLTAGRYELELEVPGERSRRSFSIRAGDELTLRFP